MGATTLTMIGWSEELSLSIMKSIISHLPIVECTKVKGTCKTWDKFTRRMFGSVYIDDSDEVTAIVALTDTIILLGVSRHLPGSLDTAWVYCMQIGTDCDPAHDHDLQIW